MDFLINKLAAPALAIIVILCMFQFFSGGAVGNMASDIGKHQTINYNSGLKEAKSSFKSMGITLGGK